MKKLINKQEGFTLIELMIVVVIIGILASIAIPNFQKFQLRTKSAEGSSSMGAIANASDSFNSKFGSYIAAAVQPRATAALSGIKEVWAPAATSGFILIGWEPTGALYFNYSVVAGTPDVASTAVATRTATNAHGAVDSKSADGRPVVAAPFRGGFVFAQANIDEDTEPQGYVKGVGDQKTEMVPDPLLSGEDIF